MSRERDKCSDIYPSSLASDLHTNTTTNPTYPTYILCTTADIFLGLNTVLIIMETFLTLEKCVNVNKKNKCKQEKIFPYKPEKKYFHILEISSLDHAV